MLSVLLSGCGGKMGGVISSNIAQRKNMEIIAGVDPNPAVECTFPVFTGIADFNGQADVIIDFSHPAALASLLEYSVNTGTPAVLATTGYSSAQIDEIKKAAAKTALFFTANMSLGINLLVSLAKKAAAVLSGFDIEIIEAHHNQKIDAPSGTAIMLADSISEVLPEPCRYVYDRHSQRKKRDKREIGLHAVRGGSIVGEHEILFAGDDEVVTLTHKAYSKNIFAVGSINAAAFLAGKAPGLYDMSDLVANA
ncbi:MAG TPA: 4-hydroxy-tetrahydrodipicolinate reductase [Ruminococcaceae bacterium]|nr:4-hydroxy-tetrahydrodipicolinate reductase [Oscillospiraceae bacterium]